MFFGQIRIARRWVLRVLFRALLMIFLFIASVDFWFAVFAVIGRIRFTWWWVWLTWIWLRILWYVLLLRFFLRFENYVVSVSVLGYGVFAPTGVKSKGDIFAYDVFVPTGAESKVGRIIKIFWRSNSLFYFQIWNSFIGIVVVRHWLTRSNHCSITKIWLGALQWKPSVVLRILVAGVLKSLPSSNALMVEIPRSTSFGAWLFGWDLLWRSSYSACRYPGWNRRRVCHQLTCWKWTSNWDYWATFHQQKRPIFGIVWSSLVKWIAVYSQPTGSSWGHRVGQFQ